MRKEKLRKTGIKVLGDKPWGTHFCQFYQTKKDILDILIPYFKTGLENNEFCMWITSEPLIVAEAKSGLKKAVRNLDEYIKRGQIEILDYTQWYTKSGKFDADRVLDAWVAKEKKALKRGFDGLRLTVNTLWFEKKDWKNFTDYEEAINNIIGKYRMMAICSYSLDKCGASEVIDVVSNHQFALIKRKGKWEFIESSEHIYTLSALKESEEKYRMIFENVNETIIYLDKYGTIVSANDSADTFGFTPEDLIGKHFTKLGFFSEKDIPKYLKLFKEAITDRKNIKLIETEIKHKDGHEIPIEVSIQLVKKNGKIEGIVVLIQDTTKRKRVEAEMQRYRDELNTIFNSDPVAIWYKDAENKILRVNKAGADSIGMKIEEIVDKPVKEVFPEADADHYYDDDLEVMKSGKPKLNIVERMQTASGERKWVNTDKIPYRNENGKIMGIIAFVKDITEYKRAEELLLESEMKYRSLVEKANDSIYLITSDSFEYVNPAFEELTGYSLKDVCKEEFKFWDIIHPDDLELIKAREMARKRAERIPSRYEFRIVTRNGEIKTVEPTTVDMSQKGEVNVMGILRDITERKKMEKEIKEIKESYERLIDNADEAIFRVKAEGGHVIYANPAAERIFRYSEAEWKADPTLAFQIIHPDFAEKQKQIIEEININKKPKKNVILGWTAKDGREVIMEYTIIPIINGGGQIIYFESIGRDITERKKAEEKLLSLTSIVEQSTDSMIHTDKNFKIDYINKAARQLFGYSLQELKGKTPDLLNAEPLAPKIQKEIYETVSAGKNYVGEALNRKKDGSTFYSQFRISPIYDDQEEICGYLGSQRDVTTRRRAEEELKSSQIKLRNLASHLQSIREKERTNIAREIHDELGQSLTGLKMDLYWLSKRLSKDQKPLLKKIESMSKLTDSTIQTVKKISSELRPGLLDDLGISAAIEWQADEFQHRTGINIKITLEPNEITLDRDRSTAIFRIFQETLTNVARHSKASAVKLNLTKKPDLIKMSIKDNGIGITEDQIQDPTAYGLIGIRERVHILDGEIKIKGVQNKGTSVTVYIPLSKGGLDQ